MRTGRPIFARVAVCVILAACSRVSDPATPSVPVPDGRTGRLTQTSSAVQTLPFFQSSFVFAGKTFTYKMVGSNPFTAPASVTIPTEIIPVELRFANGDTFSPTTAVNAIAASPIFNTGKYPAGTLQYGDAVMRSEFWKFVSNKNYHVLLGTPFVEHRFVLNVPSADGFVRTSSGVRTAFLTSQFFLNTIEPQLLSAYHVSPASIAFFAVTDMRVLEAANVCCFNGYHDSFTVTSPAGTSTFTTVWALVASSAPTQLSHLSHEVAELLNDPFYPSHPNIVPSWVHPTANVCDGDLLEVGDPVVNARFMVNGDTVQDVAFFSWFSRQAPSIGIDRVYDLLGTLKRPAVVC